MSSNYAKRKKIKIIAKLKVNGLNKSVAIVDKNIDSNSDIETDHIDLLSSKYTFSFEFPKLNKGELKRSIWYIAGPSEAGKTTYAAELATNYRKYYPKNKIVFISTVNDNPVMKKLKPIMINIADERKAYMNLFDPETKLKVLEDDMETSMFQSSLVIYDDLEGITDKHVLNAIQNDLITPMLNIGRHKNISVIFCKHLLLDYTKTRNILVEMDYLTVYPSSSRRQIRNCLERYLGLEKDQVNKILNCGERSVTIHCKYPMFAFTKSSAWII